MGGQRSIHSILYPPCVRKPADQPRALNSPENQNIPPFTLHSAMFSQHGTYQLTDLIPRCPLGALLLCPCLFRPSDIVWRSRCADAPWCAHFSTVISPSWITEQISVGKCKHRGASASRERQTSFKIVTWTKQTWTKHHNTAPTLFTDRNRR